MPKKIKLTEKTIHVIADRLRKFFQRNEYTALQNVYKKEPMSNERHHWSSPFYCVEKSDIYTIKCAGIKIYPEIFYGEELLLCLDSSTSDRIGNYHVGDVFIFSPTHIKVKARSFTSFEKKCMSIICSGNEQGYNESIEDDRFNEVMSNDMLEMITFTEPEQVDPWL